MSYLRGPMTRDQIAMLDPRTHSPGEPCLSGPDPEGQGCGWRTCSGPFGPPTTPTDALPSDVTAVMPEVASGVPVRWLDVAAPWLGDVGGDSAGAVREAAIVARVAIRYDETKADLVHDEEFEAVLFPLGDHVDVTKVVQVDYDDRDLRTDVPVAASYRLPGAKIATKAFFTQVESDLRDHLTRSLTLEIPANTDLKLYGRPGESADDFAARCADFADDRADEEIAKLRDKYEAKATRLRDQIEAAEDRVDVLEKEADAKRNSELLSTAGSFLGGLLGGTQVEGQDGRRHARRRRYRGAPARQHQRRREPGRRRGEQGDPPRRSTRGARGRRRRRHRRDRREVGRPRRERDHPRVGLERTDVKVTQLALAWIPVA